jgi:hypothetical protein
MKKISEILVGAPFGFPLGWAAARINDGQYAIAAMDLISCLAVLCLVTWLSERVRS